MKFRDGYWQIKPGYTQVNFAEYLDGEIRDSKEGLRLNMNGDTNHVTVDVLAGIVYK